MVYLSLGLAVTLMCTILIVFRIVTVGRANRQTTLGGYRAVIEIVVESAGLLSIILVIYMVTYVRGTYAAIYVDAIAASIRVRFRLLYSDLISLLCRELPRLSLSVVSLLDIHVPMIPGRNVHFLPYISELATIRKHKLVPNSATSARRHLVFKTVTSTQTHHWKNRSLQRKKYDSRRKSQKVLSW